MVQSWKTNGKSQYKYVVIGLMHGKQKYRACITKLNWRKYCDTEKEAAICVDKYLLSKGLEPVNILKPKL